MISFSFTSLLSINVQLYFLGKCLKVVQSTMNWTNAVSNCEKENATLVIIHSAEENQFLNG